MKKIDEILTELGFKKDAPDATKRAFIRHLVKAAEVSQIARETEQIDSPRLNTCLSSDVTIKTRQRRAKVAIEQHQLNLFTFFAKASGDN